MNLFKNMRRFLLRGKRTVSITLPWWNVPRCFFCNRILWGSIITITAGDNTVCWDCEREDRLKRHSTRELAFFFGKPTVIEKDENMILYDPPQ